MPPSPEQSVFLNCPFDEAYQPLFRSIIFAVHSSGFEARCALEISNATQLRLQSIFELIAQCRYGIHDISRTELDPALSLPRFNMPFELGLFLGCQRFGPPRQRAKSCLILDREKYRYQAFLSDIAGLDIAAHAGEPTAAIRQVRDWLRTTSGRHNIPAGGVIASRYTTFSHELPEVCGAMHYSAPDLTFADFVHVVREWLLKNTLTGNPSP